LGKAATMNRTLVATAASLSVPAVANCGYGQWAQVRLSDDTIFLGGFADGGVWWPPAAAHRLIGRTTARCREVKAMRFQFVLLLLVVAAGLVYFSTLGVLHR
jgi:hypothetical protein